MVFFKRLACGVIALALSTPSPLAAKPKPPNRGIKARLASLGVPSYAQQFGPPEKRGTNLYAEVPMTTLPSPPGTKNPKRMRNLWSVVVARRIEPSTNDKGVNDALATAKALAGRPERASGTIFVFLDPSSADAAEAFAELVWMTGRTVTSVDCSGMGDASACTEAFAKWNLPTRR